MTDSDTHVPLPGSERLAPPAARVPGAVDAEAPIEVTLLLRRPAIHQDTMATATDTGLRARHYLSRAEFRQLLAADPADIARVEAFAHAHGLQIVAVHPSRPTITLRGSVGAMSSIFRTKLTGHVSGNRVYRVRSGPVMIPRELSGVIQGVFGLDDRPVVSPSIREAVHASAADAGAPTAALPGLFPTDVARLYNFPPAGDGNGQCIGIIEFAGGYHDNDLTTYFGQLHGRSPQIIPVSVLGTGNTPAGFDNGDGEVTMDIEIAGAVAPGAKLAVYFAPNTTRGFIEGITAAVHDDVNHPSVLSISWGESETPVGARWTAQAMRAIDRVFKDAAALGITVVCAAGDAGGTDGQTDHQAHVEFPASSPHALTCGGTRLQATAASILDEVVWNDGPGNGASGGGISGFFPLPAYQHASAIPSSTNPAGFAGRGIPDVAGNARSYRLYIEGRDRTLNGTSAVAPLWAGLIARLNQLLGTPVGFLNPLLYSPAGQSAFRDIIQGTNGVYSAAAGWDPCSGLGVPDGSRLLSFLQQS